MVNNVSKTNNTTIKLKHKANWLVKLTKGIQQKIKAKPYNGAPKRIYGILLPYFSDFVWSSINPNNGSFIAFQNENISHANPVSSAFTSIPTVSELIAGVEFTSFPKSVDVVLRY